MISATPPPGEYDTGQSVVLSCDENVDIYFTTDGSEPSIESQRYQSPVIIPETTVIKFMAVDNAGNQSQTVEARYVIVPLNIAPVADAGPDLRIFPGKTAILDGSGSDDPDDGPSPLVFSWIFVDKPMESGLSDTSIIGSGTFAPEFVPDVPGTYELQLTVHDGADSDSDSAEVVCEPAIIGDLDADGDVDGIDRNIVLSALGKCSGDVGYVAEADYDSNGCIRLKDYRLWLKQFVSYVSNNACSVYIKADLNKDAKVDFRDLLIMLRSRGKCKGHPYFVSKADYNANGCIDHWDYIEWMAYNGARMICLY